MMPQSSRLIYGFGQDFGHHRKLRRAKKNTAQQTQEIDYKKNGFADQDKFFR